MRSNKESDFVFMRVPCGRCRFLKSIVFLIFTMNFMILLMSNKGLKAQTIDNYLVEAAENNPGLKSSYLEFEAAMQKTAQAKALPDPSLSFGYFVSPVETRVGPQRARFSLVQMFPWFGTNGSKADVYAFNAQAKYQDFLEKKNLLYYQLKVAYYPIYEVHEKIRWQQENLNILKSYKRLATTKFSTGSGAMADVLRVDIMIDQAETEIELLEEQLHPLTVAFNRLINRPDSLEVEISDVQQILDANTDFDADSLVAANPALQSIEMKIQGAHALETVAAKQGLPTFGAGIDYVLVDKRTDMDLPDNGKNVIMPMVTMSLPIFRGKYNSLIKEAQLNREALTFRKVELENNLNAGIVSTRYDIEKALSLHKLYDRQITRTRQTIDLLNTAYANDQADLEEILRMEQQMLMYHIYKAQATKEYLVALAKLNYLTARSE